MPGGFEVVPQLVGEGNNLGKIKDKEQNAEHREEQIENVETLFRLLRQKSEVIADYHIEYAPEITLDHKESADNRECQNGYLIIEDYEEAAGAE